MVKEVHKESYEEAIQELSDLMELREEYEAKLESVESVITRTKWAVKGIAHLCNADPEKEYPHLFPETTTPDIGFTDAIREVLNEEPGVKYAAPVHIRNALEAKGFNIKKYQNPLASIHTILKRLHKSGEAKTMEIDGRLMYTGVITPRSTVPTRGEDLKKRRETMIEAVREVLKANGEAMSTAEIATTLIKMGSYRPSSTLVVPSIINTLHSNGEVVKQILENDMVRYRWATEEDKIISEEAKLKRKREELARARKK